MCEFSVILIIFLLPERLFFLLAGTEMVRLLEQY